MKIEVDSLAVNQVSFDQKTKHLNTSAEVGTLSIAEDSTTLNLTNHAVNALTRKALEMPQVRQGKVEAIRQSISAGLYSIDPEKVAAAIIANTYERLSEVNV
jgi:flagellar biosynthesis anti-sigma factor FlgM